MVLCKLKKKKHITWWFDETAHSVTHKHDDNVSADSSTEYVSLKHLKNWVWKTG